MITTSILIASGTGAIACSLIEIVLSKLGKQVEAQLLGLMCLMMLSISVVSGVLIFISEITKLV